MLNAVLVHHILAEGVQNNRQPLPRAGVLLELVAHNLPHSLPAKGLVDLLGRNEPVGEGVENPLLVRRDLHDSLVDGRVTARAGDA